MCIGGATNTANQLKHTVSLLLLDLFGEKTKIVAGKAMPKIASVIVDGGRNYRFEASRAFKQRLATLEALVEAVSRSTENVETLMFPAGYFCTKRLTQVDEIAERVVDRLIRQDPPFVVVWGVDGWTEDSKQEARCGSSGYPFFVFARLPASRTYLRLQQIATSAAEGRDDRLEERWNGRAITLGNTRTALLVCGECWSDRLMERVEATRSKILLIPAHRNVNLAGGKSRRSWHLRLSLFSERMGIPIVLSEHSRSPWRHTYLWGGRKAWELDPPDGLQIPCTIKLIEF